MKIKVRRVTNGPKHHLFGFHDLVQTNAREDFALSLEIDDISHPPLPGDICSSGVVDLSTGNFRRIHDTHTWNYPQGARQQWIGGSDFFTCNDRDGNGKLISWISDAREGTIVEKLPFPIHCCNAQANMVFWMNYDRTYACGGYGYSGGGCKERWKDIPDNDGIYIGNLKTKESNLLVSLADVALCGEEYRVNTGYPHIVTHFLLNPNGTRLAFLHRYLVPDGGGVTRLMTIGVDGRDMRCLAKGFLSHFTWVSDNELFIWGADQRSLCAFRELPYLRLPGVLQSVKLAKSCMRACRNFRRRNSDTSRLVAMQDKAFLLIEDRDNPTIEKTALGLLTEDGHPMANPAKGKFLINDTYPDSNGDRTLMFFDIERQYRKDIGKFRMLQDKPNQTQFDWKLAFKERDSRVNRKTDKKGLLFAFSGFHCDLHPRWSYSGNVAYFDSIHEGSRQVYAVEFEETI